MYAAVIVCIVAMFGMGVGSLCIRPSSLRAGATLIGLGIFNTLLAFVHTPEAASVTQGVEMWALLIISIFVLPALMFHAGVLAYEGGHPFGGFLTATAVTLTAGHIVLVTHMANIATVAPAIIEALFALVLGGHLFRLHEPSRIPAEYRNR